MAAGWVALLDHRRINLDLVRVVEFTGDDKAVLIFDATHSVAVGGDDVAMIRYEIGQAHLKPVRVRLVKPDDEEEAE